MNEDATQQDTVTGKALALTAISTGTAITAGLSVHYAKKGINFGKEKGNELGEKIGVFMGEHGMGANSDAFEEIKPRRKGHSAGANRNHVIKRVPTPKEQRELEEFENNVARIREEGAKQRNKDAERFNQLEARDKEIKKHQKDSWKDHTLDSQFNYDQQEEEALNKAYGKLEANRKRQATRKKNKALKEAQQRQVNVVERTKPDVPKPQIYSSTAPAGNDLAKYIKEFNREQVLQNKPKVAKTFTNTATGRRQAIVNSVKGQKVVNLPKVLRRIRA